MSTPRAKAPKNANSDTVWAGLPEAICPPAPIKRMRLCEPADLSEVLELDRSEATMVDYPRDLHTAIQAGKAFGAATAERTITALVMQPDDGALRRVGLEGVARIILHAKRLIAVGIAGDIVTAWLDSAADAFSAADDVAVRELRKQDKETTPH